MSREQVITLHNAATYYQTTVGDKPRVYCLCPKHYEQYKEVKTTRDKCLVYAKVSCLLCTYEQAMKNARG